MAKSVRSDRKLYGVRLSQRLMQAIKHLAVDEGRAINDLTEEALSDLLRKYGRAVKQVR